ncbi:discoidin domain-containing protein [Vibrio jasicida]|uniref:discoidin domain-containing protein n=1 Tax=Vibrio jasicida TaxID=766224 RepID=UPI00163EE79B|nr:discoidin domain-containing protein [Vibrio jasicida]
MKNNKENLFKLGLTFCLLSPLPLYASQCDDLWKDSLEPNNLEFSIDTNSLGGRLFVANLPNYRDFTLQHIVKLNQLLYLDVNEVPYVSNLKITIHPFSNPNCDGVAYKSGGINSTNIYINSCFLESLPSEKVEAEIKGILVHELVHAYQNSNFEQGSGTLEGVADAVRYLTEFKSLEEKRTLGGDHNSSYDLGAFWIDWLRHKLLANGDQRDFLYELNKYAGSPSGFNWQNDITDFFSNTVDELWREYQTCLHDNGNNCPTSIHYQAIGQCDGEPQRNKDLAVALKKNIKASDENKPYETAYNAFDNSNNTKWLSFADTGWISYQFDKPALVSRYTITSANDVAARDPKAWLLQGSINGHQWQTLDSQDNQFFTSRHQTRNFDFSPSIPFSYYRLNITENAGADIIQLAEVELLGNFPTIVNLTQQYPGRSSASASNAPKEDHSHAFDENRATKWLTFSSTGNITYYFPKPVTVHQYSLTSANDASDRDPQNWKLLGSNDGVTWQILNSQTQQSFTKRFQTKLYQLATPLSYQYIKLEISKNHGSEILQLAELTLKGNI